MRTKNVFISPVFERVFIPQKLVCDKPRKKRKLHKMSAAYEKGYPKTGFSLII